MNKYLITLDDIIQYRQISTSVNHKYLNPYIMNAQRVDVLKLVGERLYIDLITNTENHTELLEGGIYTHEGETFMFDGLKKVLAAYTYARYYYAGGAVDTPFGVVQKKSEDSAPIPINERKTVYTECRNDALSFWSTTELYMIRKQYPGYASTTCQNEPQKTGSMNFTTISRY